MSYMTLRSHQEADSLVEVVDSPEEAEADSQVAEAIDKRKVRKNKIYF